MHLVIAAERELRPGAKWQRRFLRLWPGYRRWFLAGGGHLAASLAESERALRRHMPELVPVWERQVALAGEDALAARFLTGWCPPRYVVGCSQAAVAADDGVWLVRNYDLDPRLNEGVLWHTAWTGQGVIATGECLNGAADGINAAGLAVSLAFGGRLGCGRGFGVPHVVRYLLEVAGSTAEAVAILARLPVHMAYNLTLADRGGNLRSVMVGPDRPAESHPVPVATNHQERGAAMPVNAEERRRAVASRSVERRAVLERLVTAPGLAGSDLADRFLASPLYTTDYASGFGTVYTAALRPDTGSVSLRWPGHAWSQSLAHFLEESRQLRYRQGVGARLEPLPPG